MSGEPRSGQYQGTRFTPVPIKGTAFQLSQVDKVVKIIPKDMKPTESYCAKKNEKLVGLRLFGPNGKRLDTRIYSTLTEAKKAAKSYLSESRPKVYIDKSWSDRYGYTVKSITVHVDRLSRIGEMKSMPKVAPKSYLVIPEYLWAYDGVLCDYEYEFC